jgi:hypothetical protein
MNSLRICAVITFHSTIHIIIAILDLVLFSDLLLSNDPFTQIEVFLDVFLRLYPLFVLIHYSIYYFGHPTFQSTL